MINYNYFYNRYKHFILIFFILIVLLQIIHPSGATSYKINMIKVDNIPYDIGYSKIKYKNGILGISAKEDSIYWIYNFDNKYYHKYLLNAEALTEYYKTIRKNEIRDVKLNFGSTIPLLNKSGAGPPDGPWAIFTTDVNFDPTNEEPYFKSKNQVFILEMNDKDELKILSILDNFKDDQLIGIYFSIYVNENTVYLMGYRISKNAKDILKNSLIRITLKPYKYEIILESIQSDPYIDCETMKMYCIVNNFISEVNLNNNDIKTLHPFFVDSSKSPATQRIYYFNETKNIFIFDLSNSKEPIIYIYNIKDNIIKKEDSYWFGGCMVQSKGILCKKATNDTYVFIDCSGNIYPIAISENIQIITAFISNNNTINIVYQKI